jgi:23S rRNA (pseudouridine1915-N3)-methyltransferase
MKYCLLLPGKIKPKGLETAELDYIKRLKAFPVEVVEYKDEKVGNQEPAKVKDAEADRVFRLLKPRDYLIACDERGQSITTEKLARFLGKAKLNQGPASGKNRVVFVIGGALGLSEKIHQRADEMWQLSGLVMAGGVARIVLLEGLYRAFTILENYPYHNS